MKYGLITEPWVTVVCLDGEEAAVGLREVLTKAHQFRKVRHPLPTVEFGLYRLLVVLVLDIFFLTADRERNTRNLKELLREGRFDPAVIDAYFEKYADRFDLFSEKYPFLQDATASGEDKPVANLLPSQPSGTNTTHFQHGHEGEFSLTPAEAAQILTTIAPFMTAGGAGLSPSLNGAPPIYVLLTDDLLFETLCRNLCALDMPLATGEGDAPAWRWDRAIGGERTRAGYAESLTWTPRRIRLMPGDLIRTMKFAPGDSVRLGEGVVWRDPSCAYREGEKGATILRLDKGREIWRDTGPLALLRASDTSEGYVRPRLLDQIRETGYRNNAVSLSVYGMRTDLKMKVFEWRRETLSFPLELIEGTAEYRLAVTWMDQAEKARLQFSYAVKSAYPRGGQGNKNALAGCIAYAERGFWATLRPKYAALLRDLAELKTGDIPGRETLRLKWKEVVENAAWRAFDTAVGDYDTDNHALERLTRARRQLDAALHRLFETAAEKQEREAKSKTKARGKKNAADNAEGVNYE